MLVGVPLFGDEVAPRFGFAQSFLISEISNERVINSRTVKIASSFWSDRLREIKGLGVEVLLCGGFNRTFLPLAEDVGLTVLSGFTGEAVRLVEAYARGEDIPTFPCAGFGMRRRGGRRCEGFGGPRRGGGGNNRFD